MIKNMSDKKEYITEEGLKKLKEELNYLKSEKRKEIANRIRDAKELGDLSENAEYAEAKNEQSFIEGRILQIENLLKNVTLIKNNPKANKGMVAVGSKIRLKCENKELQYTIVGSNEADPDKGLISNESPLGQAFLGKKLNDKVEITVPAGTVSYEITDIK